MSRFFCLSAAILAAAMLSGQAAAHSPGAAHQHGDFGQAGDPKKSARVVQIAMREEKGRMVFVPDRVEVRKGEQIRFVLSNDGELNHEFVLGTRKGIEEHAREMKKSPEMEHDDDHSITLGMYATGEVLWRFTKAGHFVFACLIPGHLEKGMIGSVVVK